MFCCYRNPLKSATLQCTVCYKIYRKKIRKFVLVNDENSVKCLLDCPFCKVQTENFIKNIKMD